MSEARDVAYGDASDAIHLVPPREAAGSLRWGLALVWFMRTLAILWLVQTVGQWDFILSPGQTALDALPPEQAYGVALFAVLDPIAAVGLWFAASWGGVVWLLTVAAQVTAFVLYPLLFVGGPLAVTVNSVLSALYLVLAWLARQEERGRYK